MENETQNEMVAETATVETDEQKTKRRVPSYFLIHVHIANPYSYDFQKFDSKKELRDFLETNHVEDLNPIIVLGHEVPITFNKVVKVDF